MIYRFILGLLLLPSIAWGQAAVQQTGSVTNNSPVMWARDHVVRQAAGAAGDVAGKMITGGFSAVGNVCSYSNTTDQSGIGLCLDGANGQLIYNGTGYPVSGGGGNVVGPASSVSNEIPGFNNTVGTLLKGTGARQFSGATGTFLFDPSQTTQQQFKYTGTLSGSAASSPTDTNNTPILWYRQEGALVGRGLNTGVALAEFDITDTGALNNTDSYQAVVGNCNLTTARSGAGFTACIGVTASSRAYAAQGGGSGTEKGEVHGVNIVTGLSTLGGLTPTFYDAVIGAEADIVGCPTCTQKHRIGYYSVDFGTGAGGTGVQGTSTDAAFAIGSVAGTAGWKYGIDLVGMPLVGGNALSNTGTVLGSSAASPTVATQGVDLNNFTISGNAFRGPAGTFFVTGAGNVQGVAITATNGFITDTAAGVTSVVDFRNAGTSRWTAGREATTNDFIITNPVAAYTAMRITAAAGVTTIGLTNPINIGATGSLTVPGVSTSVGTIAGSVCMDANHMLIYKVGANCI